MKKWPQLLVDIEKLIDAEVKPDSEGAQRLAKQWLAMLQGYAGNNPSTQAKIRTAMQNEPSLADGTGSNQLLYNFWKSRGSLNVVPSYKEKLNLIDKKKPSLEGFYLFYRNNYCGIMLVALGPF